jgi:hypothetical protein
MGEFAEARKRLVAKIEGCEETHQHMVREYLARRGVNIENYYRLNVEIGVGEFGMNEWNRLADISTGTKRYLGKIEIQRMNHDAAAKLARIHKAKARLEGREFKHDLDDVPEAYPAAIELPAEVPVTVQPERTAPSRPSYEYGQEKLAVPHTRPSPRGSGEHRRHKAAAAAAASGFTTAPGTTSASSTSATSTLSDDRFITNAPTPSQYRNAAGQDKIAIVGLDEYPRPKEPPIPLYPPKQSPPPIPPKTPIEENPGMGSERRVLPPYPLNDSPPPVVNMARKPNYHP